MSTKNIEKQHVFFLFFHLGLGGIQRKIVDLVNHIEDHKKYKNIVPHIVVRRTELFNYGSDLPEDFQQLHVESVFPNKERKISYIFFLVYLILVYNPRVLVPFLHHTTAYCVLMKYLFFWKKIKVIVSQDNMLSLENQLPYSIRTHSNKIVGWCYRRADTVIVMSESAKQDLVKNYHVNPSRVIVIQNWIKDTKLHKQPKKYDLFFCGRFASQKRPIKLLQTIRLIKPTLPSIKLCLIGAGPEEQKLRRYIKRHSLENNVIIKPPTQKIIAEIARAKLFILTSDFEGHPLVLLEAMAQKVVPVFLSYPGADEQIKHEINGFVEPSIRDMSNRIISLLQNPQKMRTIGQKARQTVLSNHNQSLMDKTLKVLLD